MVQTPNKRKETIPAFDFMRVFCAFIVIYRHFLSYSKAAIPFPDATKCTGVVVCFIMLSGFVLFYNYPEVADLKQFYFKRFKAIFPMFWICYAYFFIQGVFKTGDLFWHDQPWSLVFSVLGIDGYLDGVVPTYYYTGEWFLGVIIVLYLLYPVLCTCVRKHAPALFAVLTVLYILMFRFHLYLTYPIRSVISSTLSFCLGMLIAKHRDKILDSVPLLIASAAVTAVFFALDMWKIINEYVATHIFGICLFFILYHIGKYVMRADMPGKALHKLSALSYPVFLVQHQIIDKMMGYQNPSGAGGTLVVFVFTLALILVSAWVLDVVTKAAVKVFFTRKTP